METRDKWNEKGHRKRNKTKQKKTKNGMSQNKSFFGFFLLHDLRSTGSRFQRWRQYDHPSELARRNIYTT